MKILKHVIILLLGVVFFSNCEREKNLNIDFPYNGDELVLYAFVGDSIQHAEVYKTQQVLESNLDFNITPTRLELLENENFLISFDSNQDNFVSNISLDTLSSFQVELESEGKFVVSDPIYFPEKIRVKSYQALLNEDSSKVLLNFSFDDKQGEHFYFIKVDKYYQGQIDNFFQDLFYEDFRFTFSDEDFSAQTYYYEEELDLEHFLYDNGNIIGLTKSDAISISLYSVSKEIYEHYKSVQQNSSLLGSVEESNTPIWTNISEGHGVVGAYRKDFVFINF